MIVRLPESLRPWFLDIANWYRDELGVRTVLRSIGGVQGEYRRPSVERLTGVSGPVEVVEFGIRYRFDPERILFARGNRVERHRAGEVTRPGDSVVDLFAGIGYFTLPAAVVGHAGRVIACELNPESFGFLRENVRLNHVEGIVQPLLGDHRELGLPPGEADRVFLGYLPTSIPYLRSALPLLRPRGGWVHAHLVTEVRVPLSMAVAKVREAVERLGGGAFDGTAREVKPYGPGRRHVVVDLFATPKAPPG